MLINVKMPTIIDILAFMRWINFVLSCVEHENCFITSGPDYTCICLKDAISRPQDKSTY